MRYFNKLKEHGKNLSDIDARKCRGCNAKEKAVCWSAFLEQPTPIRELSKCPDPMLNAFKELDERFKRLEEAFRELANHKNKE